MTPKELHDFIIANPIPDNTPERLYGVPMTTENTQEQAPINPDIDIEDEALELDEDLELDDASMEEAEETDDAKA